MLKIGFFLLSFLLVGINGQCSSSANVGSIYVSVNYVSTTSSSYLFQLNFTNFNAILNNKPGSIYDVHAIAPVDYVPYLSPSHFDVGNINGGASFFGSLSVVRTSVTTSALAAPGNCGTWTIVYRASNGTMYANTVSLLFEISTAKREESAELAEIGNSHDARVTCATDVTSNVGTGFSGIIATPFWNGVNTQVGSLSGGVTLLSVNLSTVYAIDITYSGAHAWSSAAKNTVKTVSVSFDCEIVGFYDITVLIGYTCGGSYYLQNITTSLECSSSKKRSIAAFESNVDVEPIANEGPMTIRADYAVAIASAGLAVAAVAVIAAVVIIRNRKVNQLV